MNNLLTAQLSPLPKELIECALPYGLSWDELLSVLPSADAGKIEQSRAYESHRKQGLNGGPNSCILLLRYPADDGSMREETVFIKHTEDPDRTESGRYRFLESRGIAVPRLLGAIPKGEGEVIIQEFLSQIGIDFTSDDEVTGLLHLIADLNAITDLPVFCQPWPGMPQDVFNESVRLALVEMSSIPGMPEFNPQRWYEAYLATHDLPKTMPQAASHGEMGFQQVGVAQRRDGRQVVMFDLETLSLAARFSDIGGILYPLSECTGCDEAELFGIYLEHYAQRSGQAVNFEDAFLEMKTLRIPSMFESVPWLVDETRNPESVLTLDDLLITARSLKNDLSELGWVKET